ncbi:bifunctional transcriptional activator/DNA repair enzyme AdaA [Limosilactobacillus allomucosae]|uniref:Ada metal-binding domain-containing protein n=1 Tax=Limosilactobacillus allomucosae TaxID=3142938 RepID=A0ABV0I6E8_9LACO
MKAVNNTKLPNDEQWHAIINNDSKLDGQFWYGVTTTHIFCKPSCPSRLPKRDHVLVFTDPQQAIKNGFRPCKRCRPLNRIVNKQIWVDEIEYTLKTNYQRKLTLNELGQLVHGDPSYLRHTFKDITGMTPRERLNEIRLTQAQHLLQTTQSSVSQVGREVGMSNTAYFIDCFKKRFGKTPLQYRRTKSLKPVPLSKGGQS